jgi:hypothetical protein
MRFWKDVRCRQGIFATARCRRLDRIQQDEAERLARRACELEAEAGWGTPARAPEVAIGLVRTASELTRSRQGAR